MSDVPQTLDQFLDAQETTPEEAPAEASPPTQTAEAPTTPEADPFESGADSFPREYVQKLRQEAAGYRTRARELEEAYSAFAPYSAEDRQVWTSLAKTMVDDPKQAAKWMREIAEAVAIDYPDEPAPAAEPDGEGSEPQFLTKADYDKLRADERKQTDVVRIEAEAKALGYDLDGRDYVNLLLIAQHETKGDITAAHEALKGDRQKIIDEYLSSKQADAQNAPVAPAGPVGTPASGERPIKDFKDARAALEEYLAAQPGT
jgi:hypothetical protein